MVTIRDGVLVGDSESFFADLDSDSYDIKDDFQCLSLFYRVLTSAPYKGSYFGAISTLVRCAAGRFGATTGIVLHPVSDSVCEVIGCHSPDSDYYVGQHLVISDELCGKILFKNETYVDAQLDSDASQKLSLAYNYPDMRGYLGNLVASRALGRCLVMFLFNSKHKPSVTSSDKYLLEQLAEGIAVMIDLNKSQVQRHSHDISTFAEGSVKTLDEYLSLARVPDMLGVPARVVEILEQRIGAKPLGIGHIAEELNLSKRTLQRRLQQQDVNFAELRDKVRFRHSIDYLIKQHMSIDSISNALDFSDRTSFTNAFKRWTGLSPSTFRKLFRDYV